MTFVSMDSVDNCTDKSYHHIEGTQVEVKRATPREQNPGGRWAGERGGGGGGGRGGGGGGGGRGYHAGGGWKQGGGPPYNRGKLLAFLERSPFQSAHVRAYSVQWNLSMWSLV